MDKLPRLISGLIIPIFNERAAAFLRLTYRFLMKKQNIIVTLATQIDCYMFQIFFIY